MLADAIFYRKLASVLMTLVATSLLVVGAQSCGGYNSLYESISTTDTLQYDSTLFGVQTTFITLSYLRKDGGVVAKLAIDTDGLSLASGSTISGTDFMHQVSLTRNVTDQNQVFPAISRGSINFDDYSLTPGATVSGHFAVTFDTSDFLEGDFSGNFTTLQLDDNTARYSHPSAMVNN